MNESEIENLRESKSMREKMMMKTQKIYIYQQHDYYSIDKKYI